LLLLCERLPSYTEPMRRPTISELILGGSVLLLLPLCLLGYGADNDTYTVLDSGISTWHLHLADTSRNPGYWVFEAIVFALRGFGGSVATNLATLAVAIIVLWRFVLIAKRLGVVFPYIVATWLAVTPVFVIAATSTVDYLWSLLGLVLFVELLVEDRLLLAILPAAFAFAIRGANGPLIAGAIVGAVLVSPRRASRFIGVGLAVAILGGLPYVESYRLANHSFAFLHALAGPDEMWSTKMRVGRFIYKSCYLFGPIATAFLAGTLFRRGQMSSPGSDFHRRAIAVFLGVIVANSILFLWYPIEISYLLPAAFFLLLLVGMKLEKKIVAIATLLLILSLNFVTPQFARPNIPGHATGATFHPSLEPGILVEDIRFRLKVRQCEDYRCYFLVLHPGSHDLDYTNPIPLQAPLQ